MFLNYDIRDDCIALSRYCWYVKNYFKSINWCYLNVLLSQCNWKLHFNVSRHGATAIRVFARLRPGCICFFLIVISSFWQFVSFEMGHLKCLVLNGLVHYKKAKTRTMFVCLFKPASPMPLTSICFQKHSIITWRAVKSQEWKQIAFHWISVSNKIYQERNLFERQQLLKKPKSAIVIFLSVLKFWWINSQQCLSRLFSNQKNNKLVILSKQSFFFFN